jgi:FkbM family methyltransferase
MEYLGTEYGGWLVDLDLIPERSTIVSAGIGEDISFDLELIKQKRCNIIGVDPTPKSHSFIERQNMLTNFLLVKKALDSESDKEIKMYKNSNPNHVSESILPSHFSVKKGESYLAKTISLQNIFEKYDDISLIKMDIEGSEYNVLNSLETIPASVKQMCIEFHHFCTDHNMDDTHKVISLLKDFGFKKHYMNNIHSSHPWAELTFVRE